MRRCDICSTIIPIGTDHCPNCGFQYKPERKLDGQRKVYLSQFQPHPSPLDDFKKPKEPMASKEYGSRKNITKLIEIILPALALIVMISIFVTQITRQYFEFSSLIPEYTMTEEQNYYTFYDYDHLSSNFEEAASEVKPYYVYAQNLHDKYCEEGYVMYEEYITYEDIVDYATMDTTLCVDNIYFSYSLYKPSQYDSWQEMIATSLEGENQEAVRVMADFINVDYNTLYYFYSISEEGYYEYDINGGMFCVDTFDGISTLYYCHEIYILE